MQKTTSATKQHSTGRKACTTYKRPVLVRVNDKVTGELLGYLAEPEQTHQYGDLGFCKPWYQVSREDDGAFIWWRCTCKGNAVYGKQCKHIRAAKILSGEIVEAEVVATPEVGVIAPTDDMSVAEHFIEEEMKVYERDLQEWGIAELRQCVKVNGLSVTSRAKAPLIVALVAHRRGVLLAMVPASDANVSPECPQGVEDLPELPSVEAEILDNEPLEGAEFADELAEQWTTEEIERIREAAQPKVSTIETAILARMTVAPLNGNRGFSILR